MKIADRADELFERIGKLDSMYKYLVMCTIFGMMKQSFKKRHIAEIEKSISAFENLK